MIEQAVVLGGSGGLGKAVVDSLISRNIPTKVLVRDLDKFKSLYPDERLPGKVNVLEGDLDSIQALAVACEHTDTIFLCFNTDFKNWDRDMTKWISNVGKVAAHLGARIMYRGNIYNIGLTDAKKITEEHPQNAHTNIGQLSIAIEQRLAKAVYDGASLTIIRFPQLFGPAMLTNDIGKAFTNIHDRKPADWYGNPEMEHEFLFTVDAGEAMVEAALSPKASDSILHFPGIIIKPSDLMNKYAEMVGSQEAPYKLISNLKLSLKSAVSRSFILKKELLYIYEQSQILDGTKYSKIVKEIDITSIDEALKRTYQWISYWHSKD